MAGQPNPATANSQRDTETLLFTPRRAPGEKTFISVRVSYDRAEDAQRYFRWNFLTPQDTVEQWRVQPKVPDSKHKYVARVSLVLGQDQVPPRAQSRARWEQHVAVVESQLSFWLQWIDNLKADSENPVTSSQVAEVDYSRALRSLWHEKEATADELIDIVEYRDGPVHQRFNMACEVVVAPSFCFICNTVAHHISQCEARKCTVCGSKSHPHFKCPKKCNCKTRPPHMSSACPKLNIRTGPEKVSLRRLQMSQQVQYCDSEEDGSSGSNSQAASSSDAGSKEDANGGNVEKNGNINGHSGAPDVAGLLQAFGDSLNLGP